MIMFNNCEINDEYSSLINQDKTIVIKRLIIQEWKLYIIY